MEKLLVKDYFLSKDLVKIYLHIDTSNVYQNKVFTKQPNQKLYNKQHYECFCKSVSQREREFTVIKLTRFLNELAN